MVQVPWYCAASLRSARRAEIKRIFALVSRPAFLSSRNVWHTTKSTPALSNPRVIQRPLLRYVHHRISTWLLDREVPPRPGPLRGPARTDVRIAAPTRDYLT